MSSSTIRIETSAIISIESIATAASRHSRCTKAGGGQCHRPARASARGVLRNYILRGGFTDGVAGLTISLVNAYSVLLKFAKLWELQSQSSQFPTPNSNHEAHKTFERHAGSRDSS
jgi:hypothetical protein